MNINKFEGNAPLDAIKKVGNDIVTLAKVLLKPSSTADGSSGPVTKNWFESIQSKLKAFGKDHEFNEIGREHEVNHLYAISERLFGGGSKP